MFSSEDKIEFKTLSVAERSAALEASNLLRTSSCDIACSGVTLYGSLLRGKNTSVYILCDVRALLTGRQLHPIFHCTWLLRWTFPAGWPRSCTRPLGWCWCPTSCPRWCLWPRVPAGAWVRCGRAPPCWSSPPSWRLSGFLSRCPGSGPPWSWNTRTSLNIRCLSLRNAAQGKNSDWDVGVSSKLSSHWQLGT